MCAKGTAPSSASSSVSATATRSCLQPMRRIKLAMGRMCRPALLLLGSVLPQTGIELFYSFPFLTFNLVSTSTSVPMQASAPSTRPSIKYFMTTINYSWTMSSKWRTHWRWTQSAARRGKSPTMLTSHQYFKSASPSRPRSALPHSALSVVWPIGMVRWR